jgi:hypothetical protein
MIADDRETTLKVALKLITAPVRVPIYFAYVGCRRVAEARAKLKAKATKPAIPSPVQPSRIPRTDIEGAVYAALVLAGGPVNNRRLAELMDCSPGEASRRVAHLDGVIRKARKGREVLISLH